MLKILDVPLSVDFNQLRIQLELLLKENRVNSQYLNSLESELKGFLENNKLTVSCVFSLDDFSVSLSPLFFNDFSLISNTDVLINDNVLTHE